MTWRVLMLVLASVWTWHATALAQRDTQEANQGVGRVDGATTAADGAKQTDDDTKAKEDGCGALDASIERTGEQARNLMQTLDECIKTAKAQKHNADAHAAKTESLLKPGAPDGLKKFEEATLAAAEAGRRLVLLQKRRDDAKEIENQAELREKQAAAAQALEDAQACREAATKKAGESELDDAKAAVKDARKKTKVASGVAERLRGRTSELRALIERQKGEREVLRQWLQAAEAQATRTDLTAQDKAQLTTRKKELSAQIDASRESQELLEEIAKATEDDTQALEQKVEEAEKEDDLLVEQNLKRIELKNGDRVSYGVTLAAVRLRATRDPSQDARERDYQPEAEFVPTLLGLRVVYEPSPSPWRIRTAGEPLQLIGIEFALYLEKADGNALESLSAGVGLTLMEGLLGVGLAFDVYRQVPVKGGHAETGIMPWALSRGGEVTAENVSVMVTIGLEPIVKALTGSTDENGGAAP